MVLAATSGLSMVGVVFWCVRSTLDYVGTHLQYVDAAGERVGTSLSSLGVSLDYVGIQALNLASICQTWKRYMYGKTSCCY